MEPINICGDCTDLAGDILNGLTYSSPRWKVLRSVQNTLCYTEDHINGTVDALQNSAAGGCWSCRLLAEKALDLAGPASALSYYLFIQNKARSSCKFQISLNHPSIFLKHVQYWKPTRSLEYFGLQSTTKALSCSGVNSFQTKYKTAPFLARLPTRNPGSSEAIQQAVEWLEDCRLNHKVCSRLKSILPKRVLDLRRFDQEEIVSLYISHGEIQPYCTLSYTWGETDRLVTSRVQGAKEELSIRKFVPVAVQGKTRPEFKMVATWDPDNIPRAAFPQTHQHALQIASRLGFRYIWIDSLCIIQGDKADWAQQGAAMTDIYGRASLTLSASSSEDSTQGLWRWVKNEMPAIGLLRKTCCGDTDQLGEVKLEEFEIYLGEERSTLDLEEKFLSTRGWVFQERLVSTASLHYSDEGMIWECIDGVRLSHDQNVSTVPWKAEWRAVVGGESSPCSASDGTTGVLTSHSTDGTRRKDSPGQIWFSWVTAYSERNLYDSKDKFPAFAGIATKFQERFGARYVAGLWVDDIVRGLLWRRHGSTKTLVPLRESYVAPSWSWASVRGRLEYRDVILVSSDSSEKAPMLRVDPDRIKVKEEHTGTLGRIQPGASLVATGELQLVLIDRELHPGVRKRPHQQCGVIKGFRNPENVMCTLDEWKPSYPRYEEYWALRVGSYFASGREGDVFLLLQAEAESSQTFRRVGVLETDPWFDVSKPTPMSGELDSPTVKEVMLV